MNDVKDFVDRFASQMHTLETQLNEANWVLETTSSEEAKNRVVELEVSYSGLFQDAGDWASIQELRTSSEPVLDPEIRRQIDLLYREFAANRDAPDRVEARTRLATDISADFTTFRAHFQNDYVSDNIINQVLRDSNRNEEVHAAWLASKAIGPLVSERVVQLAGMRNESARELGYRDFYAMQLDLQEIDEEWLFRLLSDLDRETADPYARHKAELDARLALKFSIDSNRLMPWNYGSPFFQEPPAWNEDGAVSAFQDRDPVALSVEAFDRLGMDIRDVVGRSDLYERPGKNQHAFETHIDRMTDDVRVLCNVRSDEYWAATMLHEMGHAVYDKYLGNDLPFLLRTIAHINSTEAIAMIMGRLTKNHDWVTEMLPVAAGTADSTAALETEARFGMLLFVRWVLVMVSFEKALYENPLRKDLNEVWWGLVGRYQMLPTPPGRTGTGYADWATKIHVALYPVYYHNYLLGELTASQIQVTLEKRSPGGKWYFDGSAGAYLRNSMFVQGATFRWDDLVAKVTGSPLTASAFLSQFVETHA